MSLEETGPFAAFVASMPPAYRQSLRFRGDLRLHAARALPPRGRGAHVEIWRSSRARRRHLRRVADDKPPPLRASSAAPRREPHRRRERGRLLPDAPDGRIEEVVDFLHPAPAERAPDQSPRSAREGTSRARLTRDRDRGTSTRCRPPSRSTPPAPGTSARVRFAEGEDGTTLPRRSGLVDRPACSSPSRRRSSAPASRSWGCARPRSRAAPSTASSWPSPTASPSNSSSPRAAVRHSRRARGRNAQPLGVTGFPLR